MSSVRFCKDSFNFQWVISDYKKLQDQKATVQGPTIQSSHSHEGHLYICLSFKTSSMNIFARQYDMSHQVWICNCFFMIPKQSIFVKVPDTSFGYKTEIALLSVKYAQVTPSCTADETLTIGIKGFVNFAGKYNYKTGCGKYFGASCHKKLEMIFKNGTFSDLCVKDCEGVETFRVHQAVLASASDTLRQLLKENKSNAIIELKDASRDNIADILTYIYCGTFPNIHNNAKDILITADRFRLEDLANECVFELLKSVNPTNVANYLSLASELSVYGDLLKSPCISLIKQNYYSVYRTESWKALRETSTHLAMDVVKKVHTGKGK